MLLNPVYNIQGPTSGPHRWWRVFAVDNYSRGSTPAISADNIEMRATPGGSDLTTTASNAISDSEFSGSFLNDYAFNGINSQFWVSENFNPGTHWIGYDFGSPVDVQEIVWSKRPDSFGRNEAIIIGLVQYSDDGSTWFTSWAFVTPATWGTGAETRTFTKQTGGKHFWRIRPTSVQGGSTFPFAVAELEFRSVSGGADEIAGGVDISSTFTDRPFAFDNVTSGGSNYAQSSGNVPGGNPWIGYAFTSPKEIVEILYQLRGDASGANRAITAADIQSSLDMVTWTTEWSLTTPATWVNSSTEQRVFTKP